MPRSPAWRSGDETGAGGPPREEGDRALGEGRYADAARHYLEARDRADVDLLFRLGKAYAGDGDVGRAVLSYERARLLAPRNGVVRDALDALRRRAGLERDLDRGRAIVVAAGKSDLRVSPDRKAAPAGTVRAGKVVEATRSRGDFVLVTRPGAAAGWIERPAVEQLIP